MVAARASHAGRAGTASENHRAGGAVEFWNRHHDGALDGQQSPVGGAPLGQGLELHRMRCHVRDIEFCQDLLGGPGVVVSRSTDQGEAGKGHHGVHHNPPVVHEVGVNRRARIQARRKRRNDAQAACFQGGNHSVIVVRVARQQVGAQHQHADCACHRGGWQWQLRGALRIFSGHARVVDAGLRIFNRCRHFGRAPQHGAFPGSAAVNDVAHHVEHVVVRSAQPVLQCHEVRSHVLRGAGNETQQLRQAA